MENKETLEKGKLPTTSTGTSTPTQSAPGGGSPSGSATQQSRYTAPDSQREGRDEWSEIKERGAEFADKAKQTVTEAYDKTSQTLNEGYGQAIGYGRENPGKTVLIAFGVGLGIGVLLTNTMSPRSRAGRIVPPVMNALSDIAAQLFR